MKILKRILLAVGVIVILVLVIAIFLPSRVAVKRNVEINGDLTIIFNYVADYRNFSEWNAWSKVDPEAKIELTGDPGKIDQAWHWDGDNIGKGTLTLKEIEPYNYIKGEMVFLAPMQGIADDIWKFETLKESIRVNWSFETDLDYPLGRFFGLMMDSQLGPQLEEGLQNLKNVIESLPFPKDTTDISKLPEL